MQKENRKEMQYQELQTLCLQRYLNFNYIIYRRALEIFTPSQDKAGICLQEGNRFGWYEKFYTWQNFINQQACELLSSRRNQKITTWRISFISSNIWKDLLTFESFWIPFFVYRG